MDLTLDYNLELFPLETDQSFALALASSLDRDGAPPAAADGDEEGDKDRHKWRPDGKGRHGLEDDYDYVMSGQVSWSLSYDCPPLIFLPSRCTSLTVELRRLCMFRLAIVLVAI